MAEPAPLVAARVSAPIPITAAPAVAAVAAVATPSSPIAWSTSAVLSTAALIAAAAAAAASPTVGPFKMIPRTVAAGTTPSALLLEAATVAISGGPRPLG